LCFIRVFWGILRLKGISTFIIKKIQYKIQANVNNIVVNRKNTRKYFNNIILWREVMKATGIVRRIDDLGRVVIPKEIRRSLRIREGEPLEIYTNDEGGVVFKKYSPIGEVGEFTKQYAEAINKSSGIPVAICDLDNVIAVAGISKKDYLKKPISPQIYSLLEKRQVFDADSADIELSITDDPEGRISYFSPIISEGSVVGGVMSLKGPNKLSPDETEKKLINTGSLFLSRQFEI